MPKLGKDSKGKLEGPLYTEPKGDNLGPCDVADPKSGKDIPDPLGLLHSK